MTWQGKGSTRAWRRVRVLVLDRDGYLCKINGPRCTTTATEVNHKLGRGVSEDMADLEACCFACNPRGPAGNPQASTLNPQPTRRTSW